MNDKLKNLLVRAATGTVYVGVLLGSAWGGKWSLFILFLIVTFGATQEFFKITKKQFATNFKFGTVLSIIVYSVVSLLFLNVIPDKYQIGVFLLLPLSLIVLLIELFNDNEYPIIRIGMNFFTLFYISLSLASLVGISYISEQQYNPNYIIIFFFIIWANDTFAYLSGLAFGKTKLFERISPKKTWEGTIGGAIFAMAFAFFLSKYLLKDTTLSPGIWILVSFIVIITGALGDLVESMFKRKLNIKDSGKILPGHGGILDRFDSAIFAAPFTLGLLIILSLI